MAKAIVTGASGFVGGIIVQTLLNANWDVVGLSRHAGNCPTPLWESWDLSRPELPARAMNADLLIHAAYDFSARGLINATKVNLDGTRRMLATVSPNCRILLISSMAAQPKTRQVYGRCKLATEQLFLNRGGHIMRLGLVLGDGGMMKSIASLRRFPIVLLPAAQAKQYTTSIATMEKALLKFYEETVTNPSVVEIVDPTPTAFIELVSEMIGPRHKIITVPWYPIYLALRAMEALGLRIRLSSDSLLGLATTKY